MSDYSELKRLAFAAMAPKDSPHLPCTVAFDRAASPAVVLRLIAEVEALRKIHASLRPILKLTEIPREGAPSEFDLLRKDAERYRWLRDPDHCEEDFLDGPADNIVVGSCGGEDILWSEQLDAAIDAAMSKDCEQ